ncbi:hypothetical protein HYPBUDRAFT_156520 [Hyphopichia burtonii NRRL Y-1933]|uniref:DNA mismatch repair proteins mutS family domain-containing protein n=1 Tax=Hyphopichia burtonii NRRL Y-1933 TaxID=984485 RepID=A0A1E4RKL2_9ASCO|nr:hypothetical protein HYPBUDRAFT_156520 [Hyphopichia burtonii NRRL Y-1933]ODV67776.1 hypothetical protein HYPBUDRAFT_156520 [Hyphopichia burtonii NRRL Y-1933]
MGAAESYSYRKAAKSRSDNGSNLIRTANERLAARSLSKLVVSIFSPKAPNPCQIGICCLSNETRELVLTSFSDSQTFVRAVHKLSIFDPSEVILPLTCLYPSFDKLTMIIHSNLKEGVKVIGTKSKYFDSEEGAKLIRAYQSPDSPILNLEDHKPTVAAACAVIQHFKQSNFFPNTLNMFIDVKTIKELELVENLVDPKNGTTLFKQLNHYCTKMGQRQLKLSLLQPLTDIKSIKLRLEAVNELIAQQNASTEIRLNLKKYQNLDNVITNLIRVPRNNGVQVSDQRVNNIILIKYTLEEIDTLKATLEVIEILHHKDLVSLYNLINIYINEDCTWASNILQLKTEINGLLDLSRKLYTSITKEVNQQVSDLSKKYDLSLDFRYDQNRGFYIRLKNPPSELPAVFISRIKKKNILEFTTIEILKQTSRFNDVITEITLLSNETIEKLNGELDEYIPVLFMISEAIATLDLLCCFAYTAKQGRHPLLINKLKSNLVANDYAALKEISRFQVITGPNMSGKSIYMKGLCYLVILAQIGAFVPAEYAVFPIFKNLHVRSGTDNVELTASLFSKEMSDISHILKEDGFSIAIAISEYLVKSGAMTFMSTHFHDLFEILRAKSCVSALHMKVLLNGESMNMMHKASNGSNSLQGYGIKFAESTNSLPTKLIETARSMAIELRSSSGNQDRETILTETKKRKLILELFYAMKKINENMNDKTLVMVLKTLQDKSVEEITKTTIEVSFLNQH